MESAGVPEEAGDIFLQFAKQSPDVIWMFSPDWSEVIFVTDAYEDVWGRSIEALRSDSTDFLAGVHPEDRELVREKMATLSEEEPIEAEYRVNEAEDFRRHVWVKGLPIYGDGGSFVAIAGFVRDITEKRERQQELESILNQMDDAVFVHRPDGEFLAINQTAVDRYGYSEAEFRAMSPDDMVPDEVSRPADRIGQIMSEGKLVFESTHATKDGTKIPVEVNASRIRFQEDDAILAIVRDITEQRDRKRELEVKNEQLEVLNRVIRHDIRNDMSVVIGWLETLAEQVEAESQQQMIDRVLQTSEHVVELTETYKDLLDVVTGSGSIDAKPVDLAPILWNSIEIAEDAYPGAEFTLEDGIPEVEVMANELLASVFHNLLNNAVQHSDKADPAVTVSVDRDESVVHVSFADNGPGIPDGATEAVFGKGERGLNSSSSGIGLYLVHTLMTQIGGDVWVEENEPTGSVFVVELERTSGA